MTAHSEEGHIVHLRADEHLNADDPLSVVTARTLRNNLLHLHDMHTEWYANIFSIGGSGDYITVETPTGTWECACSVPIRVIQRQDGAPADLIVKVGANYSGGSSSGNVQVNIVPMGAPIAREPAPRYSTATAALAAASDIVINEQFTYAVGSDAHIQIARPTQAKGPVLLLPSASDDSGTASQARVPLWRCDLWGKVSGGSPGANTWRLRSFDVRAYIGS